MNPMQSIAANLAGRGPWSFAKREPEQKPTGKTDRMRHYLRTQGPANAHTLADEADVPQTALVGALLKGDIAKGRIFMRAGKYHWNPQHDEQMQAQLQAAASLLRRHGFKVSRS